MKYAININELIERLNTILSHKVELIKSIKTHNWMGESDENGDYETIYCTKCGVFFGDVAYEHNNINVKNYKLTCDDILIKKLLE